MGSNFLLSVHDIDGQSVVSVCDEDLLGEVFEENEKVLDIRPPFYGGEKASFAKVLDAIKGAKTVNIVGEKIIALLLKEEVLKESGVRSIQNVKYAHIYKI